MDINFLMPLIMGVTVAVIGALPFGLVNMTVVEVSLNGKNREAMNIANGAAVVEVLFGLTAIIGGLALQKVIEGTSAIRYFMIAILVTAGLFFIFKKQGGISSREKINSGILKGIFLNMISIQVLLFWLVAVTILSSRQMIRTDMASIVPFIGGIWIGKMLVLNLYMIVSHRIVKRSRVISGNINKIIGIVLFGTAVVQFVRF